MDDHHLSYTFTNSWRKKECRTYNTMTQECKSLTYQYCTTWLKRTILVNKTSPKSMVFPPILWCNHIGNGPQEDLAKFAYKQDMKVEIFLKSCFFFFGSLLEPNCRNLVNFFPLKSFAWVEINFVWLPSGANLVQNELLVPSITLNLHKAKKYDKWCPRCILDVKNS